MSTCSRSVNVFEMAQTGSLTTRQAIKMLSQRNPLVQTFEIHQNVKAEHVACQLCTCIHSSALKRGCAVAREQAVCCLQRGRRVEVRLRGGNLRHALGHSRFLTRLPLSRLAERLGRDGSAKLLSCLRSQFLETRVSTSP